MTIGQVAARCGLQTSAIRYYEKAGLLASPSRHGVRRVYDSGVLHRLAIICFAKELGFSLNEIAVLLKDFPENAKASPRWSQLAQAKIGEMKEIIAKATAVRKMLEKTLQCDCPKLEDCARGLARARSRLRLSQFTQHEKLRRKNNGTGRQ